MKKLEPLYTDDENVKWYSHSGKVWQFLKRLNIEWSYDAEFPLLGIYLRELKMYVHAKTYTQMFIAALFIIAKNVHNKQISINWWMDKQNTVYLYNGISFGNKNEWYHMKETWKYYAKRKRPETTHVIWFHWWCVCVLREQEEWRMVTKG